MNIAHIICVYPPYRGGMGNSARQMALAVAEFKHRVSVLTPAYDGKPVTFNDGKLTVKRLPAIVSCGQAAIVRGWYRELADCDIVHLHYPFYGVAETIAALKLCRRFKLILHYHMDNQAEGCKGWFFRAYAGGLMPLILNSADAITCASLDYVKHSRARNHYLRQPRKFLQVPFGVDTQLFHPTPQIAADKYWLFVGGLDRAHYFKGVDRLLKAYASLGDKINHPLKIVGNGDLLPGYQELARSLGIAHRVEFIIDADDSTLAEYYRQAYALVLPSINGSEAFGLVLLEAMSSGLPVVAANLPGVRSVFKNGREGLLVQPDDIDDLAKKIWEMSSQPKLAELMGQRARQLAESRYTWATVGDKLNELYHRLKYSP